MEDRALLAAFIVNTTLDTVDASPGDGTAADAAGYTSLRAAIMQANANSGSDTIELPAGTFTLSIAGRNENAAATGDLDVTDTNGTLMVRGAGADATLIDAHQLDRIFHVHRYVAVEFRDLTITGGEVLSDTYYSDENKGAGLLVDFFSTVTVANSLLVGNSAPKAPSGVRGMGGAIANAGDLTIQDSRLESNQADVLGGAIHVHGSGARTTIRTSAFVNNRSMGAGGAIRNHSVMTIESSTFSGNASDSQGGAIDNDGGADLTLVNSTISGNTGTYGGGIFNYDKLQVVNSTIANNTGLSGGGIFHSTSNTPSTTIQNTIIADNTASSGEGPDVDGPITSLGHNLVGNTSGSSGFGASGDLLNAVPALGPLADNGGPTPTHALLADSHALDAANTANAPATDQRGVSRPQGTAADIGAFELVVTTNLRPVAEDFTATIDEDTALQGFLSATDANGNSLTFELATIPANGSAGVRADGRFFYSPNWNYNGADSFTYTVSDGNGGSDTGNGGDHHYADR